MTLIVRYPPSAQIATTIRIYEISILHGNTIMDYDVIPVGHSLAFHFHGYNIRPFLEAQLAPYSTRLTPYYKSFVGLSDTSNFAAGLESIKFTTRRAAAPSPIATGISQIIHATSTTFASPAEAVEAPTPLPSQVVEPAANSNGTSTLNNTIWLCLLVYTLILITFAAGLIAYGRPDVQLQPAVADAEPSKVEKDEAVDAPIQLEEKTEDPVCVKEQHFAIDEVTYILMVTRIQELEAHVDQLEDVEEELQARVDDLEDVEEELEGTIDSLQTRATQAGQEAAWKKEKQKLQDETSTVQKGLDRKEAENQRQRNDHLKKGERMAPGREPTAI